MALRRTRAAAGKEVPQVAAETGIPANTLYHFESIPSRNLSGRHVLTLLRWMERQA